MKTRSERSCNAIGRTVTDNGEAHPTTESDESHGGSGSGNRTSFGEKGGEIGENAAISESESESRITGDRRLRDESGRKNFLKPKSAVEAENDRLRRESEHYRKVIEHLRQEFTIVKGNVADPDAVDRMARGLVRRFGAQVDPKRVSEQLQAIVNYINNTPDSDVGRDDVLQATTDIVRNTPEHSEKKNDTLAIEYKDMRTRFRNTVNDRENG